MVGWRRMTLAVLSVFILSTLGWSCASSTDSSSGEESQRDRVSDDELDKKAEPYRKAVPTPETLVFSFPEDKFQTSGGALTEEQVDEQIGQMRDRILELTSAGVERGNQLLKEHFSTFRNATSPIPDSIEDQTAVWDTELGNVRTLLTAEQSDVEQGKRFDYTLEARSGANADMEKLVEGHVVRFEGEDGSKGRFRLFVEPLGEYMPGEEATGTIRIAFARQGETHKANARLIDVSVKKDGEKESTTAELEFSRTADQGGEFTWYSKADANQDDETPLEDVTIRTKWASSGKGMGTLKAKGGTLETDFRAGTACWDQNIETTYGKIELPDNSASTGDAGACVSEPQGFSDVQVKSEISNEDPEVPSISSGG